MSRDHLQTLQYIRRPTRPSSRRCMFACTSDRSQVKPRPATAVASSVGGPPETLILFSCRRRRSRRGGCRGTSKGTPSRLYHRGCGPHSAEIGSAPKSPGCDPRLLCLSCNVCQREQQRDRHIVSLHGLTLGD